MTTSTGSIQSFSTAAQSGSLSITVPSGTTLALVGLIGAANSASNVFSGATLTINGVGMTLAHEADDDPNYLIGAIFRLVNPSVGSQTLAYAYGSSDLFTSIGARVYVGYYKDLDTTTPIKASGGQQAVATSANTGSMAAASGDAIFAVAGVYRDTLPTGINWTNATELNETTQGSSPIIRVAAAEAFPSGNTTVTATHSGGSGGSTQTVISGVVIANAAAAGTAGPLVGGKLAKGGILQGRLVR